MLDWDWLRWSRELNWNGDATTFAHDYLQTPDVNLLSQMLQSVPGNKWQLIVTLLEDSLYAPMTPQAQDLSGGADIAPTVIVNDRFIVKYQLNEKKKLAFESEKQARQDGALRPI